mgnify:CR=1 FL=1|tara:strand:+ start:4360 stop:4848 length:489 start_codon:yes stop_codon:yes gene_type:complete
MSVAQQELDLFVSEVRGYLRDYPELNRLIDGEETSDRMIAWSIIDALDDINNTPPFIGNYTCANFPYRSLLLRATVISILESVGILQTRNQLNYSDGGIQVGVSDKTPLIFQWLQMLRMSYESKLSKWKISMNISQALDNTSVMSDYYFLGGYYDIFDRVYR